MFHPDHQGRGYATEASQAVVRLAFETYDLHRLYGRLEVRNIASARVLEKLGMRREATSSRTSGSRASGRARRSTPCSPANGGNARCTRLPRRS